MTEKTKAVVAFKFQDAIKEQITKPERITPQGAWVTTWITRTVKQLGGTVKDFGCMIHEIKAGSIPADKTLHYHKEQDTLMCVLKGRLVWCVDGAEYELGPMSFLWIPRGAYHEFTNIIEDVQLLVVVSNPDHSSDIVGSKLPWHVQFPGPRPKKKIS